MHIRETTERKNVKGSLAEAGDYLEKLIGHANAPIIVWSPDTSITLFNAAFEKLSGYRADEVIGRRLEVLFPADSKMRSLREIGQTSKGGHWETIEIPILTKDGATRIVLWNSANIYDRDGRTLISTIAQGQDITERKEAEDALRSSEAMLRGIMNATQESIWMFDKDGVALMANTKALARIGLGAGEVIGRRMDEILSPELARTRMGRLREVVETGRTVEFEDERAGMRFRHSFCPVLDASGRVTSVVSYSRDITERKRAEQALRDSEERFRAISDTASVGIAVVGYPDGGYLYVNAAYEDRLRYPRGELLGMSTKDVYWDPAERERVLAAIEKDGHLADSEVRVRRRDGTPCWGLVAARPIRYGDRQALLVTFVDITARKEAEERIARAREEWERTFDTVPDLIAILDGEHRIVRANRAMAERLARSPDGCVGLTCYECVHGTDAPPEACPHVLTLLDGRQHSAEVREDRIGGTYIVTTTPLRDGDGTLLGSIHVAHDITERKRAEQALQKARERNSQQEKLAAIGRLAGGVAHELRNPLAAMKNAAYYLDMTVDKSDPLVGETLAVIDREIARSDSIISSLLGLARPARPSRVEVDIDDLIRGVLEGHPQRKGVSLEVRSGGAMPKVTADPAQLAIAIGNIVRNAYEAMPTGGRLSVSTSTDGGWVVVEIGDTGAGMPGEVLGRLFEPLFTTKPGGTGLGLPVAKMLVEGSGGQIDARSEPGKGSVFTVRLPAKGR